MKNWNKLAYTALAAMAIASTASAAIIGTYDFNSTSPAYSTGDLNSQNSWSAATAWDVTSGGLSSTSISGGDQKLVMTGALSGSERANISFTTTSSSVVYARFNIQWNGAVDNDDFFWFGLSNGNGSADASSLGGVFRNGSTWGLHARTTNASTTNTNSTNHVGTLTTGQAYAVVIKAEISGANGLNYDKSTVWLSPDLSFGSSADPSGGQSAVASTAATSLSGLFFRIGGAGSLDAGESINVDSIAVGTTWADIAAIPEPSSAALLVGTAVAFVVFGRRRRA